MFRRFGIIASLFGYMWRNKLYWMIPMFIVLVVFGVLIVLGTSTPVGPFIYTLF